MTGRNRLKRLTVPSKVPTGHKVLQYQRPYRQERMARMRKYTPAITAAGTTRGRISTFDIIGSQPDERPARPFHAYDAGMASISVTIRPKILYGSTRAGTRDMPSSRDMATAVRIPYRIHRCSL
jgi:hypothetical protein